MSASEIVNRLAKDKVIEGMITKITKDKDEDTLQDLAQDLYLQLLQQPSKTKALWDNHQLNYFIAKVLMNNICSSTSPYYRHYIKYQKYEQIGDKEDI